MFLSFNATGSYPNGDIWKRRLRVTARFLSPLSWEFDACGAGAMRTAETGDDSCRSWESQTDWYYSVVLYPFRIQTTLDPFATRWRWWEWRLKQHHRRRRQPTGAPPPVSGRWDPEECWFRSERIRIKPVSHRPPSGSGSNTGRSITKWTSAPKPPSVSSKFSVQWGFQVFIFCIAKVSYSISRRLWICEGYCKWQGGLGATIQWDSVQRYALGEWSFEE